MNAPLVTLHPATPADQPRLRRLMQFYLYDFSELEDIDIDDDGVLGHREFIEEQFSPAHEVFLIRADAQLAGFAILTQGSFITHNSDVTDMTQFFILRAWRKRGVAAAAAQQLFARHPGPWEVRVIDSNTVARAFWRETITRFTGGNFDESRNNQQRHQGPFFAFTSSAHT